MTNAQHHRTRSAEISRALSRQDSIPRVPSRPESLDALRDALDAGHPARSAEYAEPAYRFRTLPFLAAAAAVAILTATAWLALNPSPHTLSTTPPTIAVQPTDEATPATLLNRTVQDLRSKPGSLMLGAVTRPMRNEARGLAHQTSLGARFLIARLPAVPGFPAAPDSTSHN